MACSIKSIIRELVSKPTISEDKYPEVFKDLKELQAVQQEMAILAKAMPPRELVTYRIESDNRYQELLQEREDINNASKEKLDKIFENLKAKGGKKFAAKLELNTKKLLGWINNYKTELKELEDELDPELYSAKEITNTKKAIKRITSKITEYEVFIAKGKRDATSAKSRDTKAFNTKEKEALKKAEALEDVNRRIRELKQTYSAGFLSINNTPSKLKARKDKLLNYMRAKPVYNNLVRFKEDVNSFTKLLGKVEVTDEHMPEAKEVMEFLEKAINYTTADKMYQGIDLRDYSIPDGAEAYQNISRLMFVENADRKLILRPEAVTALAAASTDWLANSVDRWNERTDDDVNRFFGIPAGAQVTAEQRKRLVDVDTLTSTAANAIGQAVVKSLGIKPDLDKSDVSEILVAKLSTELGLIGLESMKSGKLLDMNTKNDTEVYGEAGKGNKIGIATLTSIDKLKANQRTKVFGSKVSLGLATKAITKILAAESSSKGPRFSKTRGDKEVINQSAQGKYFTTAPKTQEALNKHENVEWNWNDDFMTDFNSIVADEKEKQRLRVFLGWQDPEKVHSTNREGVNGKNLAIEANIDHMMTLEADMKSTGKTKMFFNYFFGKNGRFYIDSNTFNPQGTKLHRFAINTKPEVIETQEDKDMMLLSLGMAFGLDIDKMTKDSSIKEWDNIKSQIIEMVKGHESTLDIMDLLYSKDVKDSKGKGVTPHDPEHALAGIAELRRYIEYIEANNGDSKGFEAKLVLEVDAVTSGYILKTLQMPLIDNPEYHLEGGGVFVGEMVDGKPAFKYSSFGEQAEDKGTLDAYQKPAKEMGERMPKIVKKYKGSEAIGRAVELALGSDLGSAENIAEISRKFMKSPFMVFNYGSGISKIVQGMIDRSIENFYGLIEDNSKEAAKKVEAVILSAANGFKYNVETKDWVNNKSNLTELAKSEAQRYLSSSADERLEFVLNKKLQDNLESSIKASVGVALDETFNKTYAKYIEAGRTINDSFTAMFRIFKVKLDKAVKAEEEVLERPLNSIEVDDIITTLKDSMPAVKVALAENVDDKLMIFNEESKNYEPVTIGKLKVTGQGKFRTSADKFDSAQSKTRELVESYASGAVIPIHFLDGSLMSLSLLATDSLGVHDAKMATIKDAVTDGKVYNKAVADLTNSYSLTTEILSSLVTAMDSATVEELLEVDGKYLKEAESPDKANTVAKIYSGMKDLQSISEEGRAKILSKPIRYEHVAIEGGHYDWNTEGKAYEKQEVKAPKNKYWENSEAASNEVILGSSQEALDSEGKPAIIADKIIIDGLDNKFIAANISKAANQIKKCN